VLTAQYARENAIPCLGIGMGLHAMAVEFARNVLKMADANSQEANEQHPEAITTPIVINAHKENLRLGATQIKINENSQAHAIYNATQISERHRNRYELNPEYLEDMQSAGLTVSAKSANHPEILELAAHPYYIACAYHPEFKSRPNKPHPIFQNFVSTAIKQNA